MATKPRQSARRKGAPNLVIVESPAKARTIERFLGPGFVVEASIGHVRDLPRGAKEVPARFKDEPWARLGVNVDRGFEPIGPAAGNFQFVDVAEDAAALNDALLRRGVIVRPMGSFGAPTALRITAGTTEEIDFLGEQLAALFPKS